MKVILKKREKKRSGNRRVGWAIMVTIRRVKLSPRPVLPDQRNGARTVLGTIVQNLTAAIFVNPDNA